MPRVAALRILFDKNVPIGVRRFLPGHEVRTFVDMRWHPQLKNADLLATAELERFDVLLSSDQNIVYQQNLTGRRIALVVLGSNIWPLVLRHAVTITFAVDAATPGSYSFIEMPLPPRYRR
jgi:hypothetical protein